MLDKTYKTQSLKYFCKIINNHNLDCDYRYKTILSLESKDIKKKIYFIKHSSLEFFLNKKNRTLYRILSGQLILQKCKPNISEIETIESNILLFAQDTLLDYNLRADSADVLLNLGNPTNKIIARNIIMELGRENNKCKTIFDNLQNVHNNEIEQSVLDALTFLATFDTSSLSQPNITFEYVKKQIDELLEKDKPISKNTSTTETSNSQHDKLKEPEETIEYKKKVDKINISMNRIYLDRILYTKYNCNLVHILLKIWSYLHSHESKLDMKKRLIEELVDMSGTCSTGFASRLVNVISGFGSFNLRISWRDQIIANFTGRLNAKIRNIDNINNLDTNCSLYCLKTIEELTEFKDKILEEMTINSNDYYLRSNFLTFFRKNMLSVRQELYQEFKTHLDDTSFDLYIRSAISSYETGEYN